jgi:hypothetical protein
MLELNEYMCVCPFQYMIITNIFKGYMCDYLLGTVFVNVNVYRGVLIRLFVSVFDIRIEDWIYSLLFLH